MRTRTNPFRLFVAAIMVATAILSGGCAQQSSSSTSAKKPIPKIRVGLGGEILVLTQLAEMQGEDTCTMQLYRFDSKLTGLGSVQVHEMTDLAGMLQTVHDAPIPQKDGTYFTPLLRQLYADAKETSGPVFIHLATDGGVDDPAALRKSTIVAQIAALRENGKPKVALLTIGPIHDECRIDLQKRFKALGSRVLIYSANEYQEANDVIAASQAANGTTRTLLVGIDDSKSIDRSGE